MRSLGEQRTLAFFAAFIMSMIVALFVALGDENEAQADTLTYTPTDDAPVREATASTNYGDSSSLRTDGSSGSRVETYLKYAVTNLPAGETVQSAKLRLWDTDNGTTDGPAVYTSATDWSESTITWANRPVKSGSGVADAGAIASASWVEFDVTPLVTGNATYSFVLSQPGRDGANYASKEHSDTTKKPQLVIATGTATTCSKYASPNGSNSNSGSLSSPYSTVEKLANSLGAGQTGCLKSGTYTESDNTVNIRVGGTSEARNTLTTAPGEPSKALINARISVANTADYLTLSNLRMDGSYSPSCSSGASCTILPSPTINGDYVHLVGNDISSRSSSYPSTKAGICINAGTSGNTVWGLLIENNHIHHCGRIPSSNHDHGIYLTRTRNAVVQGNIIYQNADRAVQMYPDADSTLIEKNVMAYNGDGIHFSGSGQQVSVNNVARNNVVTHSKLGWNIDAYEGQLDAGVSFPGPSSSDRNEAYNNCVYGGAEDAKFGGVEQNAPDARDYFYTNNNVIADPLYAGAAKDDYRVGTASRCRTVYSGP
jgi:hypothetical protein